MKGTVPAPKVVESSDKLSILLAGKLFVILSMKIAKEQPSSFSTVIVQSIQEKKKSPRSFKGLTVLNLPELQCDKFF